MRNIIGNSPPEKAIAQVCFATGRAIVETPDGKVYTCETGASEPVMQERALGFHPGMWLQPAMAAQMGSPIQSVDAGEHPFTGLIEQMQLRRRIHRAIDAFLLSCDPEFDEKMQRSAAKQFEQFAQDDAVYNVVAPIIMSQPLPEGFAKDGKFLGKKGAALLEQVLATWG